MSEAGAVTVARTESEVRALRDTWDELDVPDMDSDLDYFLTVTAADPAAVRPHVVTVDLAGDRLVVVARLVRQELPFKVGYRTLFSVRARALVVAFDGFLGAHSQADVERGLRELQAAVGRGEADLVVVQKADVHGPVVAALQQAPAWRRWRRRTHRLWWADLPDSWDALLAARSSKSRRQLRYDDGKLRKRYGDRLMLRRLHLPEEADRLLPDLERVARASYQHGIGVSVDGDPVQHALIDLARERGWLRVWMLYVDDQPVAFWWGIAYRGVLTIMSPGFDPAHARDRVGYFTFRRMLEDLCAEPEVSSVSFGPGDADYKERFGTRSAEVADVLLFGAHPRGWPAYLVVRATDVVNHLGRWVLDRTGWREEIRRRWRSRRTSTPGPQVAPASRNRG